MKFTKLVLILTTLTFFIAACGETETTETNRAVANTNVAANFDANAQPTAAALDEFARSKEIFTETCANCHGASGTGGEALFEGKKVKVPSYLSKGAMNASDDKLYNYIAEGEDGEMPAFKNDLTEAEMRNLVQYIRREFQKK